MKVVFPFGYKVVRSVVGSLSGASPIVYQVYKTMLNTTYDLVPQSQSEGQTKVRRNTAATLDMQGPDHLTLALLQRVNVRWRLQREQHWPHP